MLCCRSSCDAIGAVSGGTSLEYFLDRGLGALGEAMPDQVALVVGHVCLGGAWTVPQEVPPLGVVCPAAECFRFRNCYGHRLFPPQRADGFADFRFQTA